MTKDKMINFFSYVAGDDEKMMAAIFGRENIAHENAVLKGYEMCIQTAKNVIDEILPSCPLPQSPRAILIKKRGTDFELYTVRPNPKKNISGTIWKVTPQEYEYLRNYELIDCGMSEDITASAITDKGATETVQTYGLKKNKENITKVVDQSYIRKEIPSEEKIKNAIRVREEYIKNVNKNS
jgi:hypothetical protein